MTYQPASKQSPSETDEPAGDASKYPVVFQPGTGGSVHEKWGGPGSSTQKGQQDIEAGSIPQGASEAQVVNGPNRILSCFAIGMCMPYI